MVIEIVVNWITFATHLLAFAAGAFTAVAWIAYTMR
jgi:hypothetical protein